jgi:hypothetical protein
MKLLKILGGLVALAVLLFLFVANFSAKESRFMCNGMITDNGAEQTAVIFLKLEKYRWWVGLWGDSRGSAWVEIPNKTVAYFGHVTEAGDLLQFWDSFGTPQNFSGNFSTLSNTIGVKIDAYGTFEGTCKELTK